MNKRTKNIVILLIVLIIAAAAYFTICALVPSEEQDTESAVNLFTCDADSINKIEYTFNGDTISLIKSEDTWQYEKDSGFPLDTSAVDSMLKAISCVDITTNIGAQSDLSKYGLDNPKNTITAAYSGGSITFAIGETNNTTGGTYITMSEDDNIYLTDSAIISSCNYTLMQLAKAGELPSEISGATPVSLEIENEQASYCISTPITDIASYYSGYSWQATTSSGTILANTNTITAAISDINGLDLTSLAAYNVDKESLADLGFDKATKVTYTYSYASSEDDSQEEHTLEGKLSFSLAAIPDSTLYYIHIDGDSYVYTVSEYAVQSLIKIGEASLTTDELFALDYDTVSGMTITCDAKTYEISLTRSGSDGDNADISATINDKKIGAAYVEGFFDDLLSIERDSSQQVNVTGTPKLKVVFHRSTNDEYSDMTLAITPYDTSFAHVDFAGVSEGLINIRDLNSLIDSFNSLLKQVK